MWSTGLHGLRVVEATPNSDFEVESKFESIGAAQFQDEGIVVEQDASTILRFDVFNAGGGQIDLFAASVSGGTPAVKVSTTLTPSPAAPFWLRVKRTGSTWLFTYSARRHQLGVGRFVRVRDDGRAGRPVRGELGIASAGVDGDGRLLLQHREPGRPRRRRRGRDDDGRERRLQRGFPEHEPVEFREPRRRLVAFDGRPARSDQRARRSVARSERERRRRATDHADDREREPQHRRQVRFVGLAAVPGARRRGRTGLDALPLRRDRAELLPDRVRGEDGLGCDRHDERRTSRSTTSRRSSCGSRDSATAGRSVIRTTAATGPRPRPRPRR